MDYQVNCTEICLPKWAKADGKSDCSDSYDELSIFFIYYENMFDLLQNIFQPSEENKKKLIYECLFLIYQQWDIQELTFS